MVLLKKLKIVVILSLKCFASSKTCLTFVLAFGKQRGNALMTGGKDRSLTTFHYRQAVQPCLVFLIRQEA